ncbi:adenine phosphoribosyltransferase [Cumulibacter manganitolerans]|uniref:adenine phosphoribosyltransferase n=1 Tax=Cumulibacter manganitolerans TaxID=1884992 RepID=UPI001297EF02|nr:adenine phosphoribosyltransferase [Cumulibacter manganitolerans]
MTYTEQLEEIVRSHCTETPDFPAPGVLFRDFTNLFASGPAFTKAVDLMCQAIESEGGVDLVAGIEARGFLLCSAVGYRLGAGVLPIRKAGKLPSPTVTQTYALEYGEATIEVREGFVRPGQRVLLIDDVLATGGTMVAAATLLRQLGAEVVDSWVLFEIEALGGAEVLRSNEIPFKSAWSA